MNIPTKFYKGGNRPSVSTVGELKALLAELPDDLSIQDGWGREPVVVVYNYGDPGMHLQLVENDE